MRWLEQTWTDLDELDRQRTVVMLPVGAIEAHGPHLPLGTDGVISTAMAERTVARLGSHGLHCLILPCLDFTAAEFARNFPGTLSFRPSTVVAILQDLTAGLAAQGWRMLAVANSHLDPTHLACLRDGLADSPIPVAYPDLTRRRYAERLTAEFQTGACHAGQYEGSIVMAARPELVRSEIARELADNPASLVTAIREGKQTFEQAGGPRAYFGTPAGASAQEGEATLEALADILVEAILGALPADTP